MYQGFSDRSQGDWDRNMLNDSVGFAAMAISKNVHLGGGGGGSGTGGSDRSISNVCSHGSKSS